MCLSIDARREAIRSVVAQLPLSLYDLLAAAQAQHQVQGALLLDVVVSQRAAVLQLLAGEDQALLVRRDA